MAHVTYKIVQHDGGWAYTVDGVFSEPFATHELALAAARRAAAEQPVPGRTEAIEYETAGGKWHTETGSGGSAASMLTPGFAGEMFGPGQPLDASKYYIIIPDGIGHGQSSKPSDGSKTAFPKYNYEDMVDAQYRLVKEGLGIKHLRLVIGNSMGGMHTWIWGVKYP